MKTQPRPLLVLHGDADLRARLASAAAGGFAYSEHADWAELLQAIHASPASAVLVVDPYAVSRASIAPQLGELLSAFPSIPLIAAVRLSPERLPHIVKLGTLGVSDVIAIGHDDTPSALRIRLQQTTGRPLKALLDSVLPPRTSARTRALVDSAADVVASAQHGRDLALALGISRRTLLRWCQREKLPPPRRLLAWMRILHASELLDDPGRRVLDAAQATGYSSDSGLRRVTMNFVGRSPSELKRLGAFRLAARAFLAELEKHAASEEV
jgi:AraC-like DNA-binding protein